MIKDQNFEGYFIIKYMLMIFFLKLKMILFYYTIVSKLQSYNVHHGNCKRQRTHFIDVLVCNKPDLVTSVYSKPIYTGLLTRFFSFTPSMEKLSKSATHGRVTKQVTKQFLNLKFDKKEFEIKTEVKTDTSFFKLPYIGKSSNIAQKRFKIVLKLFVKIDVKIILTIQDQ